LDTIDEISANYFNCKLVNICNSVYSMNERIDGSSITEEQIESVYSKIKHELDAIKSFLTCLNGNGFKMILTIQNDNK